MVPIIADCSNLEILGEIMFAQIIENVHVINFAVIQQYYLIVCHILGTVQRRCKGGNEWEEGIKCFRVEAMLLLNQVSYTVSSLLS